TVERRHKLQREARSLYWNPQRFARRADGPNVDALIAERQRLNGEAPADRASRRERFLSIRAVAEKLREQTAGDQRVAEVQADLARCDHELAANEVLRRRDYAFCLYPEEQLRAFCTQ